MIKKLSIFLFLINSTIVLASNESRYSEYHQKFFQILESKIQISDKIQLSGEQTRIEEIISLRENPESMALLIQHRKADQSEEVLFFDLKELGLIQPHKILGDASLKNSIDQDWDNKSKTLYILQSNPSKITVLDGTKNKLARGPKSEMKVKNQFNLPAPYQSMALMDQGLIALLSPEAELHFFQLSTMQQVQTIELSVTKETIDSVTLQWRSDLKELHVIQNDKIIEQLGF